MKHKQYIRAVALFILLCLVLVLPISAYAVSAGNCGETAGYQNSQVCGSQNSDPALNGGTPDLVAEYINPAINLFSALVGVVVVISIIVGGIQYSTSAGDPQKAAKAKGRITNAIIALIAYAFLFAFVQFIIPGGLFHTG